MLFFTALLTISIVGLAVLLWFKHMEMKTGKRLFLPVFVHEKDADIARATRKVARTSTIFGKRALYHSWRLTCASCKRAWQGLTAKRKRTFPAPIQSNGSGSFYLKQMMQHKQEIRNGSNKD